MSTKPWYAGFFSEHYLRLYPFSLPPERTQIETDRICQLLNLPQQANILDLCCGYGRHAIELARRGYTITGFDLSDLLLKCARADSVSAGVEVRWIQGDMRELPFEAEFDAVINVFTSFGYLETDEEDQRVLEQVQKVLKPGGLFLQEIANREAFVRTFQPTKAMRFPDELIMVEERKFDLLTSCLQVSMTLLHSDGRRVSSDYYLRIYTLTELVKMIRVAGLELEKYTGGLNLSELTLDSVFLVMLSRKSD